MKSRIKPSNWRAYFGYRPSTSLTWQPYRINDGTIERDYLNWLMADRDWNHAEAKAYIDAMDRRTLISQHTYSGQPEFLAVPAPKLSRLDKLLADIRGLTLDRLELVQQVIDERLTA